MDLSEKIAENFWLEALPGVIGKPGGYNSLRRLLRGIQMRRRASTFPRQSLKCCTRVQEDTKLRSLSFLLLQCRGYCNATPQALSL